MSSLTAIILTRNEALHINRCIESLKHCVERIIVVDSFSTDNTVDLAKKAGADVFERPFRNHADQFNWAIDNCNIATTWTMRIDADEYVDQVLTENIASRLPSIPADVCGLVVTRYIAFLGRVIRHGGVSPQQSLKIWRTGKGRMENRWMDEHAVLSEGNTANLDGSLIDDNLKDSGSWTDKHNRYATREMVDLLNAEYGFFDEQRLLGTSKEAASKRLKKKSIYGRAPPLYRAIALFFYRYIFRLGFLDGKEGLSFNLLQTLWYRYLVDVKIIEARRAISRDGIEAFKRSLKDQHGIDV